MPVPDLHPLNMIWLVGDPSEVRAIGAAILDVTRMALSEARANPMQSAVIVGAARSETGGCAFETEVIRPRSDMSELRPLFATMMAIGERILDHLRKGWPDDDATRDKIYAEARDVLVSRGARPVAAHLFADATVAAVLSRRNDDFTVMALYPDGRLLMLPASLLKDLFIGYAERKR